MINNILLIIFLTLFSINNYGQRDFDFLKELPDTEEIKSSEFNTFAKFNISVDTLNQSVYIQDIRTSRQGKFHHFQWLYELPLENLKFEPKITDENEILIVISSPTSGSNFIAYWFEDHKISSIQNKNVIALGRWENTTENLETIKECTKKLSDYFSTFSASQNAPNNSASGSFIYTARNVTKVNVRMDNQSKIGAYFFDPFFDENNRPKSSQLLSSLKKVKFKDNSPTTVIIYSSADGNLENIQLINSSRDYPIPFNHLKIKPINQTNLPTKNLMLLY